MFRQFLFRLTYMEYIEIPGIGKIKVRRSANIKYLRLRMAPGRGVWVSVPFGVSEAQVQKFVEENKEWIVQSRKNMAVYEKDTGMNLQPGAEITTKLHVLKIAQTEQPHPSYKLEGNVITLFVPERVEFSRIEKIVQQFLVEVYRMEAKQYLPPRVKYYAVKFGFNYGRLTFRDNVSNWGSCSVENNISLNVKLIKLPDEIIDYVILHELCHTVEKNHSEDFWKLVGKVCPGYVHLRTRLKNYNTRV